MLTLKEKLYKSLLFYVLRISGVDSPQEEEEEEEEEETTFLAREKKGIRSFEFLPSSRRSMDD